MAATSSIRFEVLGSLRVMRNDAEIGVSSPMQRKILAALIVELGRTVTAERLEFLLWADTPPKTARKTLHTLVSRLRHSIGDEALVTDSAGYLVTADTDVAMFEDLLVRARRLRHHDTAGSLRSVEEALSLWRSDAYVEFRDDEFAAAEAARLEELRRVAAEERFETLLALGATQLAIADLQSFVAQHPFRERPVELLMRALHLDGRSAEALELFSDYRLQCIEELGLDPSSRLQDLELRILDNDDLDESRGSEVAMQGSPQAAVPLPAARLIGRTVEMAAVCEYLGASRLVTVVGPPGVGKTRLAMEVAEVVDTDHAHGVAWLELTEIDNCNRLDESVLVALGLRRRTGASALHQLIDALAMRDLMIVFDSCEHVLGEVAELVSGLLRSTASVRILATSRARLGVPGEQALPLAPLPVEQIPGATRPPAQQLFLERAQSLRPDFNLTSENRGHVEEICRRLDGLPLALELIAPEIMTFTPQEIVARLAEDETAIRDGSGAATRDVLHRAIDRSLTGLAPDDQRLFGRLSVFTGGFDLEGARAVAGIDESNLASAMQRLVERSLVTADSSRATTRFSILEVLRRYGRRWLAERDELLSAARSHAKWAVELAERLQREHRGRDEGKAVALLDLETVNLRAAHAHYVEQGNVAGALRLVAALHPYAFLRMRDEMTSWAIAAIELPGAVRHEHYPAAAAVAAAGLSARWDIDAADRVAWSGVGAAGSSPEGRIPLDALSVVAFERGDFDAARRHAQRALELSEQSDDGYFACLAHHMIFMADLRSDHLEAAADRLERFIETADLVGAPTLVAWAVFAQAEMVQDDEPALALELLTEALERAHSVGNELLAGLILRNVAEVHARIGDTPATMRAFQRLIAHWQVRGDWAHQLGTLWRLTVALHRADAHEEAAILLGAVRSGYEGANLTHAAADQLACAEAHLAEQLGRDTFRHHMRKGRRLDRSGTVTYARSVLSALDPEHSTHVPDEALTETATTAASA